MQVRKIETSKVLWDDQSTIYGKGDHIIPVLVMKYSRYLSEIMSERHERVIGYHGDYGYRASAPMTEAYCTTKGE